MGSLVYNFSLKENQKHTLVIKKKAGHMVAVLWFDSMYIVTTFLVTCTVLSFVLVVSDGLA